MDKYIIPSGREKLKVLRTFLIERRQFSKLSYTSGAFRRSKNQSPKSLDEGSLVNYFLF